VFRRANEESDCVQHARAPVSPTLLSRRAQWQCSNHCASVLSTAIKGLLYRCQRTKLTEWHISKTTLFYIVAAGKVSPMLNCTSLGCKQVHVIQFNIYIRYEFHHTSKTLRQEGESFAGEALNIGLVSSNQAFEGWNIGLETFDLVLVHFNIIAIDPAAQKVAID
jgi:hypothetical protein